MSHAGASSTGSVLGVDVGTVRVGFAASDESGSLATPLAVLQRAGPGFWEEVQALVIQRSVRLAVVGLPRRADGGEGEAAAMARSFAASFSQHTGCSVELWDERFTTQQAKRAMLSGGASRSKRRQRVDAVAAALLLQSWLDRSSAPRR